MNVLSVHSIKEHSEGKTQGKIQNWRGYNTKEGNQKVSPNKRKATLGSKLLKDYLKYITMFWADLLSSLIGGLLAM